MLEIERTCTVLQSMQVLKPQPSIQWETTKMAEANQPYHRPLPSSYALAATMTLARYYAQRAVKSQFKAQGLKVAYMKRRDIVVAANKYLSEHPELIERARAWVVANIKTDAQRRKRSNHKAIPVQISVAK